MCDSPPNLRGESRAASVPSPSPSSDVRLRRAGAGVSGGGGGPGGRRPAPPPIAEVVLGRVCFIPSTFLDGSAACATRDVTLSGAAPTHSADMAQRGFSQFGESFPRVAISLPCAPTQRCAER